MSDGVGEWGAIEDAGLWTEQSSGALESVRVHDSVGVDVPGVVPSQGLLDRAASVVSSTASSVAGLPGKAVSTFGEWIGGVVGNTVSATISPLLPTVIILLLVVAVALKLSGIKPQIRMG
jgi:hypothetical protein